MKKRNYILYILLCLFAVQNSQAKTLPPGVYNAGGAGDFTLFFPEDDSRYQAIQLKEVQSTIQLYAGFAVVKGEYWMHNHSTDTITMQVGYPLGATINTTKGEFATNILLDTTTQMQLKVDGQLVASTTQGWLPSSDYTTTSLDKEMATTWQITFLPDTITKVDFYILMETNKGEVLSEDGGERYNSFVYLVDAWAKWKGNVEKARIAINMAEDLRFYDIRGISPQETYRRNEIDLLLLHNFANHKPVEADNVVIAYSQFNPKLKFNKKIKPQAAHYFEQVDVLSQGVKTLGADAGVYANFDSPFAAKGLNSFLMSLVALLPLLLIIGAVVFVSYKTVQSFFVKRQN